MVSHELSEIEKEKFVKIERKVLIHGRYFLQAFFVSTMFLWKVSYWAIKSLKSLHFSSVIFANDDHGLISEIPKS